VTELSGPPYTLNAEQKKQLAAWVGYYRDLGVYDFYRREGEASWASADYVTEAVVNTSPEQELPPRKLKPPLEPEIAAVPETIVHITPPTGTAADILHSVREDLGDCMRCPLCETRNKIVFGDGDANAQVFFVGEGPGADEDEQGIPFVGRAGQLLNNMIAAMGLRRDQVYIANIVKCRPPQNRVPEPIEANTCSPFLLRQIAAVKPRMLVALGATAATYLMGGTKRALNSLRGQVHAAHGTNLVVTYHPAYLLRDPRQKAEAWKDLQLVMQHLGLPPKERPAS
jgi:DNA polymerase